MSEWWFGEKKFEKGTLTFVFITEGVGSSILINGDMHKGEFGTAGEIGHTTIKFDESKCECGSNGCLEHYRFTIA